MVPAAKHPPADTSFADFVFEGRFENRTVLWHCHLVTLASIAQKSREASQRQFIEIEPLAHVPGNEKSAINITVGLNLAVIDAAAIKKTSIMIRNYKRLHAGRHEYGKCYQFAVE